MTEPNSSLAEIIAYHYFGIKWTSLEEQSKIDINEMADAAIHAYNTQRVRACRTSIPRSHRAEGNNFVD